MAQMKNLKIAVIMAVFVMAVANGSALLRARSSQSLESDLDVSEAIRNAKMRRKRARKTLTRYGTLNDDSVGSSVEAEDIAAFAAKCSNMDGQGDFVARYISWTRDENVWPYDRRYAKDWGCEDYEINNWCTGNGPDGSLSGHMNSLCFNCPQDEGDGPEVWPKNKDGKTAVDKCKQCGCKNPDKHAKFGTKRENNLH